MRSEHAERPAAPLLLAHLSGTHAQMGAQLGAMTRAAGDWEPVLAYYPRMAEILLVGSSPKGRLAVRPFIEAWCARLERDRTQALRDRTRAFLSALGLRPELSRYFSIMDVFQNVVNLAGRYELGPFAKRLAEQAPAACSTLVADSGIGASASRARCLNPLSASRPFLPWNAAKTAVASLPRKRSRIAPPGWALA